MIRHRNSNYRRTSKTKKRQPWAQLREHRKSLRITYAKDREAGLPGVWIPEGLDRKYPKAGGAWEWQWFFPSRQRMLDPRTGLRRRHHVLDATFQHAIRQGAIRARLDKRVYLCEALRELSRRLGWLDDHRRHKAVHDRSAARSGI